MALKAAGTTDTRAARNQYLWYMAGICAFVIPGGIQTILFPWLIVVKLDLKADLLGIAQMCLQLPALLFILFGGLLADRFDGRKILMILHVVAAIPASVLALTLHEGRLSYSVMIAYAIAMGSIVAFINPARDGMLNRIALGGLQRTVTVAMGLTFGAQIFGYAAASRADTTGPVGLLVLQSLLMLSGAIAAFRLAPAPPYGIPGRRELANITRIVDGLKVVFHSPRMRPTMILLFGMSLFYGGSFSVLNPIMVRDFYDGSSARISMSFGAFMLGTILMTIVLVIRGGLQRHGRGLVIALVLGGFCLLAAATYPSFPVYLASLFVWGLFGAVAISMTRTIMQESAPDEYRARVMSIFSLGNLGGTPLGALLMGFIATRFGPLTGFVFSAAAMMSIAVACALLTPIWRIEQH